MKSLVDYINDSMLKHIAIELKDYDIIYEKYGEYNGCDELATYITNATYKLDNDVIDLDVSKLNIENTHFDNVSIVKIDDTNLNSGYDCEHSNYNEDKHIIENVKIHVPEYLFSHKKQLHSFFEHELQHIFDDWILIVHGMKTLYDVISVNDTYERSKMFNDSNERTSVREIRFQGNPELIQIVGEEVDKAFLADILSLSLSPEINRRHSDLKIVYTPIHGTGVKLVPQSLKNYGFENIIPVPEQDIPSGDFPTVVSPNPEVPSAMAMAIAKAKETNADLVMASDPDADRIGCVMRDSKGEYVLINGNQINMILHYYLMTRNAELGKLTGNEYIVKTIVTTEMIKAIADANHIKCYDCYTGFKWIASVIREKEVTGARYLGGGEESYGFLAETFARDKDSLSAISLMAEAAAWARDRGLDFLGLLKEIYLKYGYSLEEGISVVRPGKTGADEIQAMMVNFRNNPPKQLGGSEIVKIKDYSDLTVKDLVNGKVEKMEMPAFSNVLQYFTADGCKVSIRPSGTEPKIKFYLEVKGKMATADDYDAAGEIAKDKCEAIKKDLGI